MADALDIAGAQVAIRIEEKPADRFAYDFNCKLNPLDWYNQTDEYSAFNCANWHQG